MLNKALEDEMKNLEKLIKNDKILIEIYNNYDKFATSETLDDKYRCGLKIIEIYLKIREICKKIDFNIDFNGDM